MQKLNSGFLYLTVVPFSGWNLFVLDFERFIWSFVEHNQSSNCDVFSECENCFESFAEKVEIYFRLSSSLFNL